MQGLGKSELLKSSGEAKAKIAHPVNYGRRVVSEMTPEVRPGGVSLDPATRWRAIYT